MNLSYFSGWNQSVGISVLVSLNFSEFTQFWCLDVDIVGFELDWRTAVAGPWAFLTSEYSPKLTLTYRMETLLGGCGYPSTWSLQRFAMALWGQAPGSQMDFFLDIICHKGLQESWGADPVGIQCKYTVCTSRLLSDSFTGALALILFLELDFISLSWQAPN